MNQPKQPFRPWSPREVATAASIWQRLYSDVYGECGETRAPRGAVVRVMNQIATALECGYPRVHQRFVDHGASFNAGGRSKNVSAAALEHAAARREAANRQDITGARFGDPPPGYSALDKRKQARAGR